MSSRRGGVLLQSVGPAPDRIPATVDSEVKASSLNALSAIT